MFMIQLLALVISLLFILLGTNICIREILIVYYNPLPKMDGTDKDISNIELIKTRKIGY